MTSVTYAFTGNTLIKSDEVNTNFTQVSGAIKPTFIVTVIGSLATGTNVTPIILVPADLTITKAYLNVKTAPTGAAVVVDINRNGTSIWSSTQANRVQIAASATSGTQTAFNTTTLSDGDTLTFDLDAVGSGSSSGIDLTITLKCEWR
jgi:hypothetical protein